MRLLWGAVLWAVMRQTCALSLPRRGALAALLAPLSAALAQPARAEALLFADPNHPNGWRALACDGEACTLTGQDDENGPKWAIKAALREDEITLVLDSNALQPPTGAQVEAFDGALEWADGNLWSFAPRR
ncbi:hypothetical protein M885DRAFT_566928 [Pelagophyceae sp. CCMP2097]|nr:hypothetical protein M885DRAFT_566928 [Pelagophyceae sp. CCMP2097]